eukprot:GHVN01096237.1.p1 GENE.GHVN01096237.1~~GHVN01096237.1.p1  ORF type:complete len:475 (+),score=99.35 GHVN01096237.1:1003-2427(+)
MLSSTSSAVDRFTSVSPKGDTGDRMNSDLNKRLEARDRTDGMVKGWSYGPVVTHTNVTQYGELGMPQQTTAPLPQPPLPPTMIGSSHVNLQHGPTMIGVKSQPAPMNMNMGPHLHRYTSTYTNPPVPAPQGYSYPPLARPHHPPVISPVNIQQLNHPISPNSSHPNHLTQRISPNASQRFGKPMNPLHHQTNANTNTSHAHSSPWLLSAAAEPFQPDGLHSPNSPHTSTTPQNVTTVPNMPYQQNSYWHQTHPPHHPDINSHNHHPVSAVEPHFNHLYNMQTSLSPSHLAHTQRPASMPLQPHSFNHNQSHMSRSPQTSSFELSPNRSFGTPIAGPNHSMRTPFVLSDPNHPCWWSPAPHISPPHLPTPPHSAPGVPCTMNKWGWVVSRSPLALHPQGGETPTQYQGSVSQMTRVEKRGASIRSDAQAANLLSLLHSDNSHQVQQQSKQRRRRDLTNNKAACVRDKPLSNESRE